MTLLAIVKIGAIAVFVDPWISARKMAAFSGFAEPRAFIGIGKSHWLRWMERRLRTIRLTVTTGRRFAGLPARYRLEELKNGLPDWSLEAVEPDDPALITFTSGSSGEPKGANRTHRFLAAQHRALHHEFPCRHSDVDMPMFPIFALNNLVSGVTSVVPDMDFRHVSQVDGFTIARQMRKHAVTTCTASPPFIDRLCDYLQTGSGQDLRLWRILTGGAPVSARQLRRWKTWLPETRLMVAYGSTEAEPVAHIDANERLDLDRSGSGYCMGTATKLVQTRVIRICRSAAEIQGHSLEQLTLPDGEIGRVGGKRRTRLPRLLQEPRGNILEQASRRGRKYMASYGGYRKV